MKIGIYGGTFDPPHLGHMKAAQEALTLLELDKLLFIPAKRPPHKALEAGCPTPEQRLEMTRLMADGLLAPDRVAVEDLELRRDGMSYTVDTLRELRRRYPEDELWLLMGADMFFAFQDWREPQAIADIAHLAAFARTGSDSAEALEAQGKFLRDTLGAHTRILRLSQIYEISSTQVRARCDGAGLWPPVWGYILRNGLYGVNADLKNLSMDDLRACSLSMVHAKRHAHIRGVEEEAARLTQRWGGEVNLARQAGILHDCTKYWPMERHLACCKEYGISLDDLELRSEKLLHSKTGACIAKYVFGQPDQVYNAIFYHTTGKGNMTTLEKIIYLADYMEPNRNFDGVEKLRALAYTDLDAAVALGCQMSIQEMKEKGREVHPNTIAALKSLTY